MALPKVPPRTTPRPNAAPPTTTQNTIAGNENSFRCIYSGIL